jgi:hypothetical protein
MSRSATAEADHAGGKPVIAIAVTKVIVAMVTGAAKTVTAAAAVTVMASAAMTGAGRDHGG